MSSTLCGSKGAQYVYKNYKVNEDYIVFGRPTAYGGRYNIAHPDIERQATCNSPTWECNRITSRRKR